MSLAEIEVALKKLADNQVVRGELLSRLERVVERNSEAIAEQGSILDRHGRAIESLANGMIGMQSVLTRVIEHVGHLGEKVDRLTDQVQIMQSGMDRLFERMDRFIRGLEANGRRGA
jgi:hypothetical protein